MITVDLTKAKNVWKEKVRFARKSALRTLDTEFLKAQETSADTSSIVANKNTLRDLPLKVDEAKTLDAIKNVWNDLLGDK